MTGIRLRPGALYVHKCGAVSEYVEPHDYDTLHNMRIIHGCGGEHYAGDCLAGNIWAYHTNGIWQSGEHDRDYPLHVEREITP